MNSDSVSLLKECDAGCKMATESIKQLRSYTDDELLRKTLSYFLNQHLVYGERCHILLNRDNEEAKDPSMVASIMSKISTDMKMLVDRDTKKIAKQALDGCNMGVKSLTEYLHKYANAEYEYKEMAKDLIEIEKKMSEEMLKFV